MKAIIVGIVLLIAINICMAQSKPPSVGQQFYIQAPVGWQVASQSDLIENLDKFDLTDEELSRLLKSGKNKILLHAFYKYNKETHAGLIPTIQVNVRGNQTKNFNDFTTMITKSMEQIKEVFPDFKYLQKLEEIEISGFKGLVSVVSFSMKTNSNGLINVRSKAIAVPHGDYFYQINFTDGIDEEDCSELFEVLIETIRIN